MSQPLAIYVSNAAKGNWAQGILPVKVTNPFKFWPNLNWQKGNINPLLYQEGGPQYLWVSPTAEPVFTTEFTFIRLWEGSLESSFTDKLIPFGTYDIIISHAADDLYSMRLVLNGTHQDPQGGDISTPSPRPWRNVATFRYQVSLIPSGSFPTPTLSLFTFAKNIGFKSGTIQNNPGMFTWTMQIF